MGAVLVAISLTATAAAAPTSTARKQQTPELNIVIGAASGVYAPVLLAEQWGLFQKYGVNVKVLSYNGVSIQAAYLVGGQADLIISSSSGALAIRAQGQPARIAMNMNNFDHRALALVTKGSIRTIQALAALGTNCSIAAAAPGTINYIYLKVVQKQFNVRCKVSIFGTTPAIENAMAVGQVDAAVTGVVNAVRLGSRGFNVVLNPFEMPKELRDKVAPYNFPFTVAAGLDSTLKAKRDAVQRFVQAVRDSLALMTGLKSNRLAETMARNTTAFPNVELLDLTRTLTLVKGSIPKGQTAGQITAATWRQALRGMIEGEQAGISLTNPNLGFAAATDMSYFNRTKAPPLCRKATKQRKAQVPSLKSICRLS